MATYRGDGVIIDEFRGLLHMAPTVGHQHVSGIVRCHGDRSEDHNWNRTSGLAYITDKLLNLISIKASHQPHIRKLNQV